jgi:hypothetical protein
MDDPPSFMTLRTRRPANDERSMSSTDSAVCGNPPRSRWLPPLTFILSVQYGSATEGSPATTHDISRVSYHVKHIESFAQALQDVSQPRLGVGKPSL